MSQEYNYNAEKIVAANQFIVKGNFVVSSSELESRRLEYDKRCADLRNGVFSKYTRTLDKVDRAVDTKKNWDYLMKKHKTNVLNWYLGSNEIKQLKRYYKIGHRIYEFVFRDVLNLELGDQLDVTNSIVSPYHTAYSDKSDKMIWYGDIDLLSQTHELLENIARILNEGLPKLNEPKQAASYIISTAQLFLKYKKDLEHKRLVHEEGRDLRESSKDLVDAKEYELLVFI